MMCFKWCKFSPPRYAGSPSKDQSSGYGPVLLIEHCSILFIFFFLESSIIKLSKMYGWICLSVIVLEQIFVQGGGVEFWFSLEFHHENSTPSPCTNICSKAIIDRHIHPNIFRKLNDWAFQKKKKNTAMLYHQ